jgi:iron complex outermembrane receptor protein
VDVAYFQSRYFDMMEFILNNQFQFQSKNIGDTDIKGFEIEMQSSTEWPIWKINMSGGYTYIDPKYLEFDILGKQLPINKREEASRAQQNAANSSSFNNILKYRSKHLFRYDFQLDYKNIYLGLNFTYASHVDAVDWLFELDLFLKGIKDYRMNHANGYRVYDFRLGYYFRHGEFQFNIHNAFNEDYTERPGLMEAPRNLDLRFTYKF